jgi:ABC transport system ATP-binding/permease protein
MPRPGATRVRAIDTEPFICSRNSAFPARKISGRCPAERHAAPRWRGRWLRYPTSCCSTSRRTISDLPGIEWLESELAGTRSGIVLISHDRRLLERFSRTTVWLDRGITRTADQGFGAFEPWRDAILEQEETEQHKLGRKIAMEEDWLRYGVTARRTRNQRRLAELHALRRKRREHQRGPGSIRLGASHSDISGRLVAVAQSVAKSYDGRPIVRKFSTRIMRGDRVGIIGPNGAGKTTLLNMLTGALAPRHQ